jgi:hypothetical protein
LSFRIFDGDPFPIDKKYQDLEMWSNRGLIIMTSNHKCLDTLPFRNRLVILDGDEEKLSSMTEFVYILENGQMKTREEDLTPQYLPFIYHLTNGNPQVIIDQNLLDTNYSDILRALKTGDHYGYNNPFGHNYQVPVPDQILNRCDYNVTIPSDLYE